MSLFTCKHCQQDKSLCIYFAGESSYSDSRRQPSTSPALYIYFLFVYVFILSPLLPDGLPLASAELKWKGREMCDTVGATTKAEEREKEREGGGLLDVFPRGQLVLIKCKLKKKKFYRVLGGNCVPSAHYPPTTPQVPSIHPSICLSVHWFLVGKQRKDTS